MPSRRSLRSLVRFSPKGGQPAGTRRVPLSTKLVTLSLMGGVAAFLVPNIPGSSATTTFGLDQLVSADSSGGSVATSPTFSTGSTNELVVAFVSFDGPSAGSSQSVASVTGGGLTWALASQSNGQAGTAEVWDAFSTSQLSNVQVSATASDAGFGGSITVATFRAAQATVGAVNSNNASSGAPNVALQTTAAGSWTWAVGNDWDNGIARTASSGQTVQHQDVDTTVGNTFWVQSVDALSSSAGQAVSVSDTAPTTDRFDMAAVEVLPASSSGANPGGPCVGCGGGGVTIWPSSAVPAVTSASDTKAVELGTTFQPLTSGTVTGVRFYKGAGNTGTHVGSLWSSSGTLLASGTYTAETASGWQSMTFAKPVAVTAGLIYVVAYFAPAGHYSYTSGYFAQSVTTPYLSAPASGWNGWTNGRYHYGKGGAFPSSSFNAMNYWVDVNFTPGGTTNSPIVTTTTVPPTTTPTTLAPTTTTVAPATTTTVAPTTTTVAPPPTTTPTGSNQLNCVSQPSACGYPDATNSGVPAGTALSPSGSITVTTAGTVISGLKVTGTIEVRANNVTIKDTEVSASSTGGWAVYVAPGVSNTLIEDSTLHGQDNGPNAVEYGILTGSDSTIANRVNIYNCTECYAGSGGTIENSLLNVTAVESGAHYEDVYYGGNSGFLTIEHNTMYNPEPQTAVVYTGPDFGTVANVTVDRNILVGGGYTIYGGSTSTSAAQNFVVTNNRFSPQYYSSCGNFGLDAYMNWAQTTWSGNIWDNTGAVVNG